MVKHILSMLAYVIISFAVQGLSHFKINADHYAGISFMRDDPVIIMGIATMVIQGLILSVMIERVSGTQPSLKSSILTTLSYALFLGTYIAVAEPSKYEVPSIMTWTTIETSSTFVQFLLTGILIGLIHRNWPKTPRIGTNDVEKHDYV